MTNLNATPSEPIQDKTQEANNDDFLDFGDLSAFDEILLASYAVPDKEILVVSSSEVQKSTRNLSSSAPVNPTPPSTQPPLIELPINLLGSISILLNNILDSLPADGEAKQYLVENISLLRKATRSFSF